MNKGNTRIYQRISRKKLKIVRFQILLERNNDISIPYDVYEDIFSEQKRILKDIIPSLNNKILLNSYKEYEDEYIVKKSQSNQDPNIIWDRYDKYEFLSFINDSKIEILEKSIEEIIYFGFQSYLDNHCLKLPNYIIIDETINEIFGFSIQNENKITNSSDEIYKHELMGLNEFKKFIISFYRIKEKNLSVILLIGFSLWNSFEDKINKIFRETKNPLFFPNGEFNELLTSIKYIYSLYLATKSIK